MRFRFGRRLDTFLVLRLPFVKRIVAGKWPVAAQRKALGRFDIPKFLRIVANNLTDHLAHFVDGLPYNLHVVPQTLDGLAEFLHVLARRQVGTAGGRGLLGHSGWGLVKRMLVGCAQRAIPRRHSNRTASRYVLPGGRKSNSA